mmetsp:Transcript_33270/g.95742  ORF Transcript_33270/g.95742 Transcript_33270/m.95742 type:complete len:264 (+) Transcript_33270:675-1466(+)
MVRLGSDGESRAPIRVARRIQHRARGLVRDGVAAIRLRLQRPHSRIVAPCIGHQLAALRVQCPVRRKVVDDTTGLAVQRAYVAVHRLPRSRRRGRCSTGADRLAGVEPLDAQAAQPPARHEQVIDSRSDREPSHSDDALDGFDCIVPGTLTSIHGPAHVQAVGDTCAESIWATGHDIRRGTNLLDGRQIPILDLDDRVGVPQPHVLQLIRFRGRDAVYQAPDLIPDQALDVETPRIVLLHQPVVRQDIAQIISEPGVFRCVCV